MIKIMRCFIILSALIAAVCSNPFAPPKAGPGTIAPILPQNSADGDSVNAFNVISNFKYAYENRDIDVYENCLDANYVFIYIDQDLQGQIEEVEVPRNGESGDISRTERLFEAFDEIRLDTWLPRRLEPEGPEIHDGETWEIWQVTFHLSFRDLSGAFNFQQFEANGRALYKIRKSPDDYWRIIVWEDHSFTS